MRLPILAVLYCLVLLSCTENKMSGVPAGTMVKDSDTVAARTDTLKSTELADERYVQMGTERGQLFAAGEYDKWGEGLADNVVWYWSAGDSLVGKKAVVEYWKERRQKDFDTIQPTRHIWLPVKVNVPQQGTDLPGIWLLSWNQMNVKLRHGRPLQYWMHQMAHYNTQDKVDRMIVYMDRGPINAALEAIRKAEAARRRTALQSKPESSE